MIDKCGFSISVDKLYDHRLAKKYNIDNKPNSATLNRLHELIVNILDPLMNLSIYPITVEKGFISNKLYIAMGGDPKDNIYGSGCGVLISSSHVHTILDMLIQFDFDELIYDSAYKSIFISYNKNNNKKHITKQRHGEVIYKNFK